MWGNEIQVVTMFFHESQGQTQGKGGDEKKKKEKEEEQQEGKEEEVVECDDLALCQQ